MDDHKNYSSKFLSAVMDGPVNKKRQLNLEETKNKTLHLCQKKAKLSCSQCDKQYASKNGLNWHVSMKHSVSKGSMLSENDNCKTAKKVYMCDQLHCDTGNLSHVEFVKHMADFHNIEKAFDCIECGLSFKTETYLNRHFELHTEEMRFVCSFCGLQYKRQTGLRAHIKYKHSVGKRLECEHCDQTFVERTKLKMHMIHKHSNSVLFKCSVCGKGLGSKDSLKFHERIHTNERPFNCSECDKKFRSKSDLNKHRLTHSEFGAFQCKICLKSFLRKDVVKSHLKNTHYVDIPKKQDLDKCGRANEMEKISWDDFYVTCVSKNCRKRFKKGSSGGDELKDGFCSGKVEYTPVNTADCGSEMISSEKISETASLEIGLRHGSSNIVTETGICGDKDANTTMVKCHHVHGMVGKMDTDQLENKKGLPSCETGKNYVNCVQSVDIMQSPESDPHFVDVNIGNSDKGHMTIASESKINASSKSIKLSSTDEETGRDLLNKSQDRSFVGKKDKTGNMEAVKMTLNCSEKIWHNGGLDFGKIVGEEQSSAVEKLPKVDIGLQKLPVNIIDKLETVIENSQTTMEVGMTGTCISGTLEHSLGGPANLIGSCTGVEVSERKCSQSGVPNIEVLILPNQSPRNEVKQSSNSLKVINQHEDGQKSTVSTEMHRQGNSYKSAKATFDSAQENMVYPAGDVQFIILDTRTTDESSMRSVTSQSNMASGGKDIQLISDYAAQVPGVPSDMKVASRYYVECVTRDVQLLQRVSDESLNRKTTSGGLQYCGSDSQVIPGHVNIGPRTEDTVSCSGNSMLCVEPVTSIVGIDHEYYKKNKPSGNRRIIDGTKSGLVDLQHGHRYDTEMLEFVVGEETVVTQEREKSKICRNAENTAKPKRKQIFQFRSDLP